MPTQGGRLVQVHRQQSTKALKSYIFRHTATFAAQTRGAVAGRPLEVPWGANTTKNPCVPNDEEGSKDGKCQHRNGSRPQSHQNHHIYHPHPCSQSHFSQNSPGNGGGGVVRWGECTYPFRHCSPVPLPFTLIPPAQARLPEGQAYTSSPCQQNGGQPRRI